MNRWIEIPVFVLLAVVLHMALFASGPQSGSEAGGVGGDAMVTIQGAPPTVAEMVQSWESPPEVQTDPQSRVTTPQISTSDAPILPQVELADAPRAQMRVAMQQPEAPERLEVETAPPPPPPPEPVAQEPPPELPKIRPTPRPARPEPKAQKAERTTAGRAQQRAAGSGGTSQAGAGTAQTATASPGQSAQLKAVWGSRIRARIERNKRYPRGTREIGDVGLELTVSRDGQLMNYRIRRSSGNAALDKAAMSAVARARKFPKAPAELSGSSYRFKVTMKLAPR